jgi:hypothetical protein
VSAEIIDLASRRPSPIEVPASPVSAEPLVPEIYVVRIIREGDLSGEVVGMSDLTPIQRRVIAGDLIELTRAMLLSAYEGDGNQDFNVVGEYRVMASGRLTGWTSPQVDTHDKLDWLAVTVTGLAGTVPSTPGA